MPSKGAVAQKIDNRGGYEWKQGEQLSSHSGQGERYHGHELEWEQKSKYKVFLMKSI